MPVLRFEVVRRHGRPSAEVVVTAIVVLTLATACGGKGARESGRAGGAGDAPGKITVEVGQPEGAEGTAKLISTGDSLVAQTFMWEPSPVLWSQDGGQTWQPSTVPSTDRRSREGQELVAVGDLAFVITTTAGSGGGGVLPFIWVSSDGGRSFTAGTGVADGVRAGEVRAIVAHDGGLAAFGYVGVQTAEGAVVEPAHWESTDDGRTWTRSPVTGVVEPSGFPASVAVGDGTVLATSAPSWLLRSVDGGQRWSTVDFGIGPYEILGPVEAVDGLVTFNTSRRTWVSEDGGGSWRLLGPVPIIPDDEGTEPRPDESGGLRILQASGDRLLAEVWSLYNNDHYLSHLAWSDDGGWTWQPADMGVKCRGPEATSELGGPVRVGSRLVASWSCMGSDDRGGYVLVSTDEGRTWSDELPSPLYGVRLVAPVVLDGNRVVTLGAANENVEQSVDVVVEVTIET